MSPQPNEEKRQEVAVPKPDGKNGKAAASLVSSIVLILAFIAAWAGSTGHYTTLLIAVALGIASVTICAYFGWPPNKVARSTSDLIDKVVTALLSAAPKSPLVEMDTEAQPIPFEVEHDRLAKEVVRLRIQNERLLEARKKELKTTELEHDNSVGETTKLTLENLPQPPTVPRPLPLDKGMGGIPFPSGYGDEWTEYTEDVFDNIIWRWQYNTHIDQTPRNLHAYCIECQQPMRKTRPFHAGRGYSVQVTCPQHGFDHVPTNSSGDFINIKERIQRKLQDGSWIEVVNRQRLARYQAPISPSVLPPPLNETEILILVGIARCGDSCLIDELAEWFEHNDKPLHQVKLQRHLTDLRNKDFIQLNDRSPVAFPSCSLKQKGRTFLDDNHLLDGLGISN